MCLPNGFLQLPFFRVHGFDGANAVHGNADLSTDSMTISLKQIEQFIERINAIQVTYVRISFDHHFPFMRCIAHLDVQTCSQS